MSVSDCDYSMFILMTAHTCSSRLEREHGSVRRRSSESHTRQLRPVSTAARWTMVHETLWLATAQRDHYSIHLSCLNTDHRYSVRGARRARSYTIPHATSLDLALREGSKPARRDRSSRSKNSVIEGWAALRLPGQSSLERLGTCCVDSSRPRCRTSGDGEAENFRPGPVFCSERDLRSQGSRRLP